MFFIVLRVVDAPNLPTLCQYIHIIFQYHVFNTIMVDLMACGDGLFIHHIIDRFMNHVLFCLLQRVCQLIGCCYITVTFFTYFGICFQLVHSVFYPLISWKNSRLIPSCPESNLTFHKYSQFHYVFRQVKIVLSFIENCSFDVREGFLWNIPYYLCSARETFMFIWLSILDHWSVLEAYFNNVQHLL